MDLWPLTSSLWCFETEPHEAKVCVAETVSRTCTGLWYVMQWRWWKDWHLTPLANTVILTSANVGRKLDGAVHTLVMTPSWLTFLGKKVYCFLKRKYFHRLGKTWFCCCCYITAVSFFYFLLQVYWIWCRGCSSNWTSQLPAMRAWDECSLNLGTYFPTPSSEMPQTSPNSQSCFKGFGWQ